MGRVSEGSHTMESGYDVLLYRGQILQFETVVLKIERRNEWRGLRQTVNTATNSNSFKSIICAFLTMNSLLLWHINIYLTVNTFSSDTWENVYVYIVTSTKYLSQQQLI